MDRVRRELVGPIAAEEEERQLGPVPGELADDLEAHLVGPVEVVEDQHRRPVDRLEDPVGGRPHDHASRAEGVAVVLTVDREQVLRTAFPSPALPRMPAAISRIDASGTWWSCGATEPPSTRSPAASALRAVARISRVLPSPAWPGQEQGPTVALRVSAIRSIHQLEEVVAAEDDRAEHRSGALHGAQCRPAPSSGRHRSFDG